MVGRYYERSFVECITVGASIFMSSTVVVLNFLEVEEFEFSYGRAILGILVMQVTKFLIPRISYWGSC
jgi:predicted Kef-type K+ transport protein